MIVQVILMLPLSSSPAVARTRCYGNIGHCLSSEDGRIGTTMEPRIRYAPTTDGVSGRIDERRKL